MKFPLFSSIRTRIIGNILILVLLLSTMGVMAIIRLNTLETMVNNEVMEKAQSRHLSKNIIQKSIYVFDQLKEYVYSNSQNKRLSLKIIIQDEFRIIKEYLNQVKTRELTDEEADKYLQIMETFNKYTNDQIQLIADNDNFAEDESIPQSLIDSIRNDHARFITLLQQFDAMETRLMYKSWNFTKNKFFSTKLHIIIFGIIVILASILIGLKSTSSITKPIFSLVDVLTRYSKRDFLVRANIERNDELGFLANEFNMMLDEIERYSYELVEANSSLILRNKELDEQKGRLQALTNTTPDAVLLLNMNGDILDVNKTAMDMFGYDKEEFLSISMHQLKANEQSEKIILQQIGRAVDGLSDSIELNVRKKDRTIFDAILRLKIMEIGDEKYLLGILTDISDRKHAENELNETQAMLKTAIEQTPSSIIIVDADNLSVRFANIDNLWITDENGNRIYDPQKALSAKYFKAYCSDNTPIPYENLPILRAIKNGEVVENFELILKEKNIINHWFSVNASPVKDIEGNIIAGISIFHNITESKIFEIQMRQYQTDLENLVALRTNELEEAHKSLLKKERLAALGQLTATVSHEIRNPLGTIRTSVFTISELTKGKELGVERAISRAERNIIRCDQIIEELLDFTRTRDLKLRKENIDQVINSILDGYSFPEDINVSFNLSSNSYVLLDSERFRRCIINLLDNACQAMLPTNYQISKEPPEQNIDHKLFIETINDSNKVKILIKDNGNGISDDIKNNIFEPLFSTKSFGVGLGLPIVKQIIEQHNGKIIVDSEKGKGTSITLWLIKQGE